MTPAPYRTEARRRDEKHARIRWSWNKQDARRTLEAWREIHDLVYLRQVRRDRDGREHEIFRLKP